MSLAWRNPRDLGGIPVTNYIVKLGMREQTRDDVGNFYNPPEFRDSPTYYVVYTGATPTFLKGNLLAGTEYYFTVGAENEFSDGLDSKPLILTMQEEITPAKEFPGPQVDREQITGGAFTLLFQDTTSHRPTPAGGKNYPASMWTTLFLFCFVYPVSLLSIILFFFHQRVCLTLFDLRSKCDY